MALILVVEDELLVRELTIADLEDAGFDVVDARDGDAAVSLLESGCKPALIFTDLQMPGSMDGWALSQVAREHFPDLPVIYTSGLSDLPNQLGERERFIEKPYRLDQLLALVSELGVAN